MELELFILFMVVLYVFTAACLCYASGFPGSMEEVEVLKHLNRLNKPPVKSIKSPDGDIIDCVHISHQPAFDHPLLKNHTIKMRPSDHPNWIKDSNIKINASKVITQLWHSNGKCPTGTIPIIRTKKEDILRADSLKNYGKKKKKIFHVAQPSFTGPLNGHEYAHAQTGRGNFYGAKATFNLWNPMVQEENEFSLSQLCEESDGYQTTGCYDLKCSGFVQTNNEIAIGGSISPTSQVDGSQYDITILIWKDTRQGVWWMQVDGKVIGYWPASLFWYLSERASHLDFGGEIVNRGLGGQHTMTQMGNGHFPQEGAGKASYIKDIQSVDESNTLRDLRDLTAMTSPSKSCYDIVKNDNENHFFFGGPGRNQNCP
ncbi:protein neprosin-like [Bidens hawaiensis]|uniref:protein neprosin-like n=1 Tax=Bidens hawaiensis TaxID=980011 RepID=UPI0040493535